MAAVLTLTHAAILVPRGSANATAEVYKTSKGQVVVTGLTAKQKYPIKGTNAKNKPVTRKDIAANTCGEALVDGAAKYKSLVVGTETIDPATLSIREHAKCKSKKTAVAPKKKSATVTTTMPASTPSVAPAVVPSVAPAPK